MAFRANLVGEKVVSHEAAVVVRHVEEELNAEWGNGNAPAYMVHSVIEPPAWPSLNTRSMYPREAPGWSRADVERMLWVAMFDEDIDGERCLCSLRFCCCKRGRVLQCLTCELAPCGCSVSPCGPSASEEAGIPSLVCCCKVYRRSELRYPNSSMAEWHLSAQATAPPGVQGLEPCTARVDHTDDGVVSLTEAADGTDGEHEWHRRHELRRRSWKPWPFVHPTGTTSARRARERATSHEGQEGKPHQRFPRRGATLVTTRVGLAYRDLVQAHKQHRRPRHACAVPRRD
jgi:hypothetical protein